MAKLPSTPSFFITFSITTLFYLSTLFAYPESTGHVRESDVVDLNSLNFDRIVLKSKIPVFVEFFAPWCGHCKNLVPVYEQLANHLKNIAIIAKVDATVEQSLASRFDIKGFPTLKLFSPKHTKPIDYQQQRDIHSMVSFVTNQLEDHVSYLAEGNIQDQLWANPGRSLSKLPRFLLFSTKPKVSTLFKSLSMRYQNQALLFQVKSTDTKICEEYNVDQFPTLFVIPSSEEVPQRYDGSFSSELIIAYLDQFITNKSPEIPHDTPDYHYENKFEGFKVNGRAKEADTERKASPEPTIQAEIWQHFNLENMPDQCGSKMCIFALLNGNEEGKIDEAQVIGVTAETNQLLTKILRLFGKDEQFKFFQLPLHSKQSKFIQSVIRPNDHPSQEQMIIIYNHKRSKYISISWHENNILSILDRVIGGDATWTKI